MYQLSELAHGETGTYKLPADFMDRVKVHPGSVDLRNGREALAEVFRECACFVPATGSDYLYLDDENEDEGIAALENHGFWAEAEEKQGFEDAIEALRAMKIERKALGLDAVQWVLG